MRLAVISDIHSECFALNQVLQDIRRQDTQQLVCLGDALQGGSQPAEALARLRELNCPVVMGNADVWLITGQHTSVGEEPSRHQREVRAWSFAQLSQSDIAFVQHFRWKGRVQVSPFVVFPSMSTRWPALSVPAAGPMPKRPSPSISGRIEKYILLRNPLEDPFYLARNIPPVSHMACT